VVFVLARKILPEVCSNVKTSIFHTLLAAILTAIKGAIKVIPGAITYH